MIIELIKTVLFNLRMRRLERKYREVLLVERMRAIAPNIK